jgi:hypothetical protein
MQGKFRETTRGGLRLGVDFPGAPGADSRNPAYPPKRALTFYLFGISLAFYARSRGSILLGVARNKARQRAERNKENQAVAATTEIFYRY